MRKRLLEQKPWRDLAYVLALDDASRIGALRFRDVSGGPFLAATQGKLPPLLRLTTLIQAADAIHHENESAADLRHLLAEGSPLGGARPKSAVLLKDGRLAIAKFPKPDDRRDIAAGEILTLSLAKKAGIRAADHQLVNAAGRSVAVITRFDRDDHERNHTFLMRRPGRWALSPAYDLNPVPEMERVHLHQTAISDDHAEPSTEEALAVSVRFALRPARAREILREVLKAAQTWREEGKRLRIKAGTLAAYESAFEHELVEEARRLVKR